MPRRSYHRAQAELFARLALTSRDPQVAQRYHQLALEQMGKAEKVAAGAAGVNAAAAQPPEGDGETGRNP
jgi:hypothetical protein